ncbi:hypothetical protein HJ526_05865 [Donghicola sp. C2-DW-16]|uniref:Colicin transporter n=1 Tax=Donghicola mangrovi TaxID=2729614 RepID=A0A850Q1W9_9RHOB|nr:hypothetical protein [Donghicola mangrovi]NVO23607.1 hypothetical protein [Donghicola mangrovi]NVO26936.1 hypothetical protein [Donghicola mangrovi]
MTEIEELQRRIVSALDRIGQGVQMVAAAPSAGGLPEGAMSKVDADTMKLELRAALAHSEALQDKLDAVQDKLTKAEPEITTSLVAELEEQIASLKAANAELVAANTALREANGAASAETVDQGMAAELTALRAERAAEATEMKALLAVVEGANRVATPEESA